MTYVRRKYECGLGHQWQDIVDRNVSPPGECPICKAIVEAKEPPHIPANARSDKLKAPSLRTENTKAITRFEKDAFVRPHFDDGKPLMTNLRDDVREGESYAVRETPQSNETARMMAQQKKIVGANPTPWGFQPINPTILSQTGGPANPMGKPVVDIQTKRKA